MTTPKTAIAKADEAFLTVKGLLDRSKAQIADALPKHLDPDRMVRIALTSLRKNPDLLACDPRSLIKCVIEAAQLGLEPDGVLGHAYIVPYGKEAQLLPGYKGLVDLCRRSGNISTVSAEVVHEGDFFDFELGDRPHITHRPNLQDAAREDRPVIYVYAVAHLRDGGIQRCVMSRVQIDKHKERYAKGTHKNTSPWQTAWEWMAKKTVIRQLVKLLPVSVELQQLVGREEQVEAGALQVAHSAPAVGTLDELADHLLGNGKQEPDESIVDAPSAPTDLPSKLARAETHMEVDQIRKGWLEGHDLSEEERQEVTMLCDERKKEIDAVRPKKGAQSELPIA